MRRDSRSSRNLVLLFLSLICWISIWSYWKRLTHSWDATPEIKTIRAKPLTDLYSRWYGARELLLRHRDPYGTGVSRELQIAFYGRPLDLSRLGEPRDEERFAYPLYVVFLLAPFVHMEFSTVRIVFWWLLAITTVGSVALWQLFFRLSFSWVEFGTLSAMLLGSIAVAQGLSILQLGLLVSFLISAAAVSAASGQLFLAGAFLALSTIKPQLAALPVLWFAIWTVGEWRARRLLLAGFAAMLGALILASEYFLPGWFWRYPDAIRSYGNYYSHTSLLGVLFSHSPLQWPVALLAIFVAGSFCWKSRREEARSIPFAISLSFALTLTVSIVPAVIGPFNQVLLLPVVFLLILHWHTLWRANALTRFAIAMFCGCAFLPWLLALCLVLLPSASQQHWSLVLWFAPLSASFALPFAAYLVLALMRRSPIAHAVGAPQ